MRSPWKWLKRRWELARQAPRKAEVETQLRAHFGHPVKLVPASVKGGYDEIYLAEYAGRRLAVVRINSDFKTINDPIGPLDPGVPLGPPERLEREWAAYSQLYPLGLAPQPLWRSAEAIACAWVPWGRVSDALREQPDRVWEMLERTLPAIAQMHAAGVVHLDLNLGNLLADPQGPGISIIDFEFGPVDWVTPPQQQAFDYLRLIDDALKPRRGGRSLLAEPQRLVSLLENCVAPSARRADLQFSLAKLQRLAEQAEFRRALSSVFPGLISRESRKAA